MTSVPATMTAIVIKSPGGPEALGPQERPVPQPGEGEILVKVEAAGVNRPDVMQRKGLYPPPPGVTDIPGLEIAGGVAVCGAGVDRWKPGDQVAALVSGGGFPFISLPLIRAGSIKAYAVTRDMRLAQAPDIPTFAEVGLPPLSYVEWAGLFAPRGTPRDIINKLNVAVVEALADPAVRARLSEFGGEIFPREQQTPEALAALQKADAEKWWPIMKAAGIRAK